MVSLNGGEHYRGRAPMVTIITSFVGAFFEGIGARARAQRCDWQATACHENIEKTCPGEW